MATRIISGGQRPSAPSRQPVGRIVIRRGRVVSTSGDVRTSRVGSSNRSEFQEFAQQNTQKKAQEEKKQALQSDTIQQKQAEIKKEAIKNINQELQEKKQQITLQEYRSRLNQETARLGQNLQTPDLQAQGYVPVASGLQQGEVLYTKINENANANQKKTQEQNNKINSPINFSSSNNIVDNNNLLPSEIKRAVNTAVPRYEARNETLLDVTVKKGFEEFLFSNVRGAKSFAERGLAAGGVIGQRASDFTNKRKTTYKTEKSQPFQALSSDEVTLLLTGGTLGAYKYASASKLGSTLIGKGLKLGELGIVGGVGLPSATIYAVTGNKEAGATAILSATAGVPALFGARAKRKYMAVELGKNIGDPKVRILENTRSLRQDVNFNPNTPTNRKIIITEKRFVKNSFDRPLRVRRSVADVKTIITRKGTTETITQKNILGQIRKTITKTTDNKATRTLKINGKKIRSVELPKSKLLNKEGFIQFQREVISSKAEEPIFLNKNSVLQNINEIGLQSGQLVRGNKKYKFGSAYAESVSELSVAPNIVTRESIINTRNDKTSFELIGLNIKEPNLKVSDSYEPIYNERIKTKNLNYNLEVETLPIFTYRSTKASQNYRIKENIGLRSEKARETLTNFGKSVESFNDIQKNILMSKKAQVSIYKDTLGTTNTRTEQVSTLQYDATINKLKGSPRNTFGRASFSTIEGIKPLNLNIPKYLAATEPKSMFAYDGFSMLDSRNLGITKVKNINMFENLNINKTNLRQINKNVSISNIRQDSASVQELQATSITELTASKINRPILNTPNTRANIQRPKDIPELPLFGPFNLPTKQKQKNGFNVYVRSKKQFVKVNKKPLDYLGALARGRYVSDNTEARTFRVRKANTSAKDTFSNFATDKFNKKGNLYIEKQKFAIDTQGELNKITVQGWLANERKAQLKRLI